jgi:C-terminal processing protease CtpA/Prc
VAEKSPAATAGIRTGDILAAVNETAVHTISDAAQRIRSQTPGNVVLSVRRGDDTLTVSVTRARTADILRDEGLRMLDDGRPVPLGATEKDIAQMMFDPDRIVGRVFQQTHYPRNFDLYYPGFEAFMLKDPRQVVVGGIETSPASDAGVRYGDIIVSVNGTSVAGKTSSEVEAMLSGVQPSSITLLIERAGEKRQFSFPLRRASDVLQQNGKKLLNDKILPAWVPEAYQSCFM